MRLNMKVERVKHNLTQDDLAKQIGVHKNVISRWETGDSEPTSKNLIALCNLYECSPEYLLDMTDDKHAAAVAD